MSERDRASRTTESKQQLEEKSLLGSSYSYVDVGQVSSQTLKDIADNGDD
ncbi:hypothetical protein [Georgenia thermotolerans]|uniref:Uncharacterized protein n=1 Tax=Georgenia thermotolerans TaxID=527326 RepID=A0A7J5UT97_9MICO|nr:hypothetical protein [Georgenia thermotolerans]KAE8765353.1 hypothetical protein GB883_04110 [Georgenia thermotolerans]